MRLQRYTFLKMCAILKNSEMRHPHLWGYFCVFPCFSYKIVCFLGIFLVLFSDLLIYQILKSDDKRR